MDKPKKGVCKECGEVVYGLSEKELDYMMVLHSIKHKKKKDENRNK